MPIKIDANAARATLQEAADLADAGRTSSIWVDRIRHLSEICENTSKTHIAVIGTALLARATDQHADVHTQRVKAGTPGAYNNRSLAKDVLVPGARALKVSLGVTGREPLNNQPYFHNAFISRDMSVKDHARVALNAVCDMLDDLAQVHDRPSAVAALASFIEIRRNYWTSARDYAAPETTFAIDDFISKIESFVASDSEGGKRAQAVAAGLMDVVDGKENVKTTRINDPDRNFPGDVATYTKDRQLSRAIEVRDKPVTESDLIAVAIKAASFSVPRAAMLAVSHHQKSVEEVEAKFLAAAEGVTLEVFVGWAPFIRQLFFWLPSGEADPIALAHQRIYERSVELECSPGALDLWLGGAAQR